MTLDTPEYEDEAVADKLREWVLELEATLRLPGYSPCLTFNVPLHDGDGGVRFVKLDIRISVGSTVTTWQALLGEGAP